MRRGWLKGLGLVLSLALVAAACGDDDDDDASSDGTETETGGLWDAVQMGSSGAFYFARLRVRM